MFKIFAESRHNDRFLKYGLSYRQVHSDPNFTPKNKNKKKVLDTILPTTISRPSQTVIHIKGVDSNCTNVSLFNKCVHKMKISISLIKKIIVCMILYIILVSICIPIYDLHQNIKKLNF